MKAKKSIANAPAEDDATPRKTPAAAAPPPAAPKTAATTKATPVTNNPPTQPPTTQQPTTPRVMPPSLPPPAEMTRRELQAELDAVPAVAAAAAAALTATDDLSRAATKHSPPPSTPAVAQDAAAAGASKANLAMEIELDTTAAAVAAAEAAAATKNYTLWAEIVGVRKENDHLEHELTTAHSANDRLSLILSGISDRLRAQLEALLAAGLHTEERIEMFGRLKELLAYEEQFKQVQAQHAIETPAQQEQGAKGAAATEPALPQLPPVAPLPPMPTPVERIRTPTPPPPPPPLPQPPAGDDFDARATASVFAAMSEAAAEATAARARAEAAVLAANKRAEAEIAEARLLAKAAVAQAREQSDAAVRAAREREVSTREALAAVEEELHKERTRSRNERSAHQAEIEKWKAALQSARNEIERYRTRNSFDSLAFNMSAQQQQQRLPPKPQLPPQPEPPPPLPEPGNGLLDRIVLTKHWEYLMGPGATSHVPTISGGRTTTTYTIT